jgi:hypothetical protein
MTKLLTFQYWLMWKYWLTMTSDGLQNSKVKLWHKWLQQLLAELTLCSGAAGKKVFDRGTGKELAAYTPCSPSTCASLLPLTFLLAACSWPASSRSLCACKKMILYWPACFFCLIIAQNEVLPSSVRKFYPWRYDKRGSYLFISNCSWSASVQDDPPANCWEK